ncbi:Translation initiation factor IF-2 [Clarias magur]|uniref:Translation initiation factor IF-2 n=1 Tax=Clarias magur TaxID=1594786 RepID=A0A8J4WZI5_CLAMG|nr:Translation initiation factor IF-2 [Clarias magur]
MALHLQAPARTKTHTTKHPSQHRHAAVDTQPMTTRVASPSRPVRRRFERGSPTGTPLSERGEMSTELAETSETSWALSGAEEWTK